MPPLWLWEIPGWRWKTHQFLSSDFAYLLGLQRAWCMTPFDMRWPVMVFGIGSPAA